MSHCHGGRTMWIVGGPRRPDVALLTLLSSLLLLVVALTIMNLLLERLPPPPFRSVAGYFDPPDTLSFRKLSWMTVPRLWSGLTLVSVNWVGYGKVKLKCAKSHGSAGEMLIFLPH